MRFCYLFFIMMFVSPFLLAKNSFIKNWSGSVMLENNIQIQFVQIKAGSFLMGSKGNAYSYSEEPSHKVVIQEAFWMAKMELTRRQYNEVMKKSARRKRDDLLPVTNVSWLDALNFCEKLTQQERKAGRIPKGYIFSLPTEAQWEYACRAGTTSTFAGKLKEMGWYRLNSGGRLQPVGRKQPNAWGLYDMHGNVWEWCLDAWHDGYLGAPVDGSAWTSRIESDRILRGGSRQKDAIRCRSASRFHRDKKEKGSTTGFRIVLIKQADYHQRR